MADNIQFDEEQQYQRNQQVKQKPFFIRIVLATGIVSTDRQAEYVLLGVAALLIILAFMIPSFIGSAPKGTTQHQLGDELRVIDTSTR